MVAAIQTALRNGLCCKNSRTGFFSFSPSQFYAILSTSFLSRNNFCNRAAFSVIRGVTLHQSNLLSETSQQGVSSMSQTMPTTPETKPETGARRPPGPRTLSPLTNAAALQRDPIRFALDTWQRYGDVVHFRFLFWPAYVL